MSEQEINDVKISAYAVPGISAAIRMSREKAKAGKIIENVCAYLGIPVAMVKKKGRKTEAVYARQWCIWFIVHETRLSLKEIGQIFDGRDHTSVINSRDVVKEQLSAKHYNFYTEDYTVLREIVLDDVPAFRGRPSKRVAARKEIAKTVQQEDVKVAPIIRHKAAYTNTNFEQQLEERAKVLAI